jgi:DNA-binding SARP family transcriptional activator
VLGASGRRLVALVAGAGWGKSLVLGAAAAAGDGPWAWLSLDERMQSAPLLGKYLLAALGEQVPGLGAGLDLALPPAAQGEAIAEECQATLSEDTVLVLDDVHALGTGPAAELVAAIVADAPTTLHLVVASRQELPFPLGRLRAAGELAELGEHDLALSSAETEHLMRAHGLALPPERTRDLHRRLEGWPAGLALAAQALAAGAAPGEEPLPPERLFAFLAEEVYERQPPELGLFLLATSVPDRFTADVAATVSGRDDAARLIAEVERRHLFCLRLPGEGGWYRYHQLFRDFLLRRLDAEGLEARAELERRSGAAWLAAGAPAEAVPHLLRAGDPDAALGALEPVAEEMATSPEAGQLAAWLGAIPGERRRGRPSLMLAEATLLFGAGDFVPAISALEAAIDTLIDVGEHDRAAAACFFLINAVGSSGEEPERGIGAVHRALDRIDPSTRTLPLARVLAAAMLGQAGRYEEVEPELDRALVEGSQARAYAGIVGAHFVDFVGGRSVRALARQATAIDDLSGPFERDPLALLPWALGWRGQILNELGRFSEALAELHRSQETADQRGLGRAIAVAVLGERLMALAGLGRHGEVEQELRAAAELLSSPQAGRYQWIRSWGETILAARGGDRELVARGLARVRDGVRRNRSPLVMVHVLPDLAWAAFDVGLGELARDVVGELQGVARAPWERARVAVARAGMDGDDAAVTEALEATAVLDAWDLWTRRERRRVAPVLARALASGRGPDGLAERIAAACGGEVVAECAALLDGAPPAARAALATAVGDSEDPDAVMLDRLARDADPTVRRAAEASRQRLAGRPRPGLSYTTLGGLAVSRGGHPLPEAAFGRPRARALLALLLCHSGAVHRDRLLEWLWPDLSPERGQAALHTTLYELRRALEPGLRRGGASSVVVTGDEGYRLEVGPRDRHDARELLLLSQVPGGEPPDDELARLERAEALWGGELLPEWPFAEWAVPMREEVHAAYLTVLDRRGEALLAAGRPREAAIPLERLVRLDPEREGAQRGLMRAYRAAGEPARALRQYQALRARLRRQGTVPAPETERLFRQLLELGPTRPERALTVIGGPERGHERGRRVSGA